MKSFFKNKVNVAILIGVLLFILLRIPSLYEPCWYGDEGIYAAVSQEMSFGETLYKDIWDNKPPLIYWIFMLAGQNNTMFIVRLFNLAAGIISLIGIFKLIKRVLGVNYALIPFFLSVYFLGSPHVEGNIANGENFFLPLIIWGLYLGIDKSSSKLKKIISGAFFAIAMLIKVNAVVDIGALVLFLTATRTSIFSKKKITKKDIEKLIFLLVGFLLPIVLILIQQLAAGSLSEFINTTLLDMFRYVGETGGSNKFIELSGMMKLLLLGLSTVVILFNYLSKRISKVALFVLLVFAFEYFGTLISSRHYIHYLLQLLPAFALLTAFTLNYINRQKMLVAKINVLVVYALGIFLALINFTQGDGLRTNYAAWHFPDKSPAYKIYAYYKNFFDYRISGRIDKHDYNYFFNEEESKILLLEETLASEFSNINKNEIYIYTDRAWTYALLDIRIPTTYSVAYHRYITEGGEDILNDDLKEAKPRIIVIEDGVWTYDEFDELLYNSYTFENRDRIYLYYLLIQE